MNPLRSIRSVVGFRGIRSAGPRALRGVANIDDLRTECRRRVPGGVFDYVDGAAEDERALAHNVDGYRAWQFQPRVLRDVSKVSTATTLLGRPIDHPLILAPTGFTRILHPDGELAVAASAGRVGIPYTLSTMSTRSIEEVAAVATGPLWFQVYAWRDKTLLSEMLHRASAAGYEAIMLTVDTAVLGRRERDVRRGFTLPPKLGPGTVLDGLAHPRWTWRLLTSEPITFANVRGSTVVGDGSSAVSLSSYINDQFDPELTWDTVGWLREHWDGPILIKGIQTVADARLAEERGADGIVLSNHGGRQLDDAPAPIDLLPQVTDVVADDVAVIVDGGIRRGSDIAKAVALGADAVMAGRPYLYGLGAAGPEGVDFALDHLISGLQRTLALVGCPDLVDLTPEYLERVPDRR